MTTALADEEFRRSARMLAPYVPGRVSGLTSGFSVAWPKDGRRLVGEGGRRYQAWIGASRGCCR